MKSTEQHKKQGKKEKNAKLKGKKRKKCKKFSQKVGGM